MDEAAFCLKYYQKSGGHTLSKLRDYVAANKDATITVDLASELEFFLDNTVVCVSGWSNHILAIDMICVRPQPKYQRTGRFKKMLDFLFKFADQFNVTFVGSAEPIELVNNADDYFMYEGRKKFTGRLGTPITNNKTVAAWKKYLVEKCGFESRNGNMIARSPKQ